MIEAVLKSYVAALEAHTAALEANTAALKEQAAGARAISAPLEEAPDLIARKAPPAAETDESAGAPALEEKEALREKVRENPNKAPEKAAEADPEEPAAEIQAEPETEARAEQAEKSEKPAPVSPAAKESGSSAPFQMAEIQDRTRKLSMVSENYRCQLRDLVHSLGVRKLGELRGAAFQQFVDRLTVLEHEAGAL